MYLLFDIGGTKMRLAVSGNGQDIDNVQIFDTPLKFEDSIPLFKGYIGTLTDFNLQKTCGALPGVFNNDKSELLVSLNMQGWVGEPIKNILEKELTAEVMLLNDAQAAGIGEAVYGSGKGYKIVAYLTVSTGVGGTRIINGHIDENSAGTEPGYQIIDIDGSVDKEFLVKNEKYKNNFGYLQRLTSGEDLSYKFGKPLEMVKDKALWDNLGKYLAAGINNTLVFWSPDVVVLGGSVAMSQMLDLETIKKYLDEYLIAYESIPPIKKAELGDLSGLWGALGYIKEA